MQAKLAHIKEKLGGEMKPFKRYPLIDAFNDQFTKILGRYRFLVIEGASQTGKTYFVKWMLGDPERVYETNCAACPEPELRDFKALYHQVILFDEAAPVVAMIRPYCRGSMARMVKWQSRRWKMK